MRYADNLISKIGSFVLCVAPENNNLIPHVRKTFRIANLGIGEW